MTMHFLPYFATMRGNPHEKVTLGKEWCFLLQSLFDIMNCLSLSCEWIVAA